MTAPTTKPPYHTHGLRPKKLDLHVHTPASKDFEDKGVTPEVIAAAAKARGLDGVAITDHNSGAMIDVMKEAGTKTGLVVFPGVEISCSGGKGGIHIIALFDLSCTRSHVEGLLSALGFQPEQYGDINAVVNKDPTEVIEIIHRRGALAILAHANSSHGALHDMEGQQRTNLIQYPYLSGVEATDFQNGDLQKKGKRAVDLLDGRDPVYQRKHAVYQASDNPSPRVSGKHGAEGIGTRCAYFRLDRITLDGLRQCLADPDVRIRQDFEYTTRQYPRITRVRVSGGFLDGIDATFHEGLNSILGAKGTGKSLLVEFIRFALNQPPTNEDILRDHKAKLLARLEDYGSVEITLTDETGKAFVIRRTFNPADDNPYEGTDHSDLAQAFPVLFLSQNEIIKIAENKEEQIQFLDRFFDFHSYQNQIAEFEGRLQTLDVELAEQLRATLEVRQLEKRISASKADLTKLDGDLKNPVFDEFSRLEIKDRAFREQLAYLKSNLAKLERAGKEFSTAPPILPDKVKEDPALRRAVDKSKEAQSIVIDKLRDISSEVQGLHQKVEEEHKRWSPDFLVGKKKYEENIQRTGGDYKALAAKRARLVKEIEIAEARLRDVAEKASRFKDTGAQRLSLLDDLKKAYEGYTGERKARCQRIEQESGGRLRVRIREASNVDEFRRRLSELKRGSYLKDSEIDRLCEKVDPGTFMRGVIQFSLSNNVAHLQQIAKNSGVDLDRMRNLAEFLVAEYPYEALLALEYKAIPQDRPEIKFGLGDSHYELLENLSVGQKCTAMLIIALGEGAMPIVIDQPEDSLDIRSIWDDICTKVRRGKEHRQFIFTTHNSSIAVAGDTDKFIIMEADATRGRIVASGSMDHPPISQEAMKYLEGGPETYRAKFKKYRGDQIV